MRRLLFTLKSATNGPGGGGGGGGSTYIFFHSLSHSFFFLHKPFTANHDFCGHVDTKDDLFKGRKALSVPNLPKTPRRQPLLSGYTTSASSGVTSALLAVISLAILSTQRAGAVVEVAALSPSVSEFTL